MIILAYCCYIMSVLDILTGIRYLRLGDGLQAVLRATLGLLCSVAGRLVMEGWV